MVVAEAAAVAEIVKRDGRIVPFDADRIYNAIRLCLYGTDGAHDAGEIQILTDAVVRAVVARHADGWQPTVEGVQDIVEVVLQAHGYYVGAKRYILYREEHARLRAERPIPQEVVAAYARDDAYFPKSDPMASLRRFQFLDKYAKWNQEWMRRETWVETVDRLIVQLQRLVAGRGVSLPAEDWSFLRRMVIEQKVMPSMRMLAMAGPAFERDNSTQYNCTYLPVDSIDAWVEGMSLSMSGCGVGYSVERDYVEQFQRIKRQTSAAPDLYVVDDSAEGWCAALRFGLERWFEGGDVRFNTSLVRPRGAPLRTKGGRASGPEPLEKLLSFTRRRLLSRQGSFLRTLDAHDIMCAVGSAAVSGGVRRTAMISLFDEDDQNMLTCKSGDFERENDQRWNANNSMVWTNVAGMDQTVFISRFMEMVKSRRGEPGIYNREAADELSPQRRERGHRFGCNPCGEVILRPYGMCNLSIAVARAGDTYETLAEKVRAATIIGTIQSCGTYFPNLRPIWKQNAEDERLLGVDITGQMDCDLTNGNDGPVGHVLDTMRRQVLETNAEYAALLGINRSAATTVNKPSGNSSQFLDCSSGIHARWAPYYIRNVRVSAASPLAKMLRDSGVPLSPENGEEDPSNPKTWVVSFPVKAPNGAITRKDRSALAQCEHWLANKVFWTEHNPSVTITYKPDEIIGLMDWVWQHRNQIGGMAFLPADDADYAQLPYIEIDEAEYNRRVAEFPEIDFVKCYRYESSDMTTASQEMACMAGVCETDGVVAV